VQTVLVAALVCVMLFAVKDAALAWQSVPASQPGALVLSVLRVAPLYLIPAVLLFDYLLAGITMPSDGRQRGLFLLPDRPSRLAAAVVVVLAIATVALAAHRRSDTAVRRLVSEHRDSIRAVAEHYGVDPRLVASIVYVTHRNQLSPFRAEVERLLVNAWATNLRGAFGMRPPDDVETLGTDENPLLNRALDISVGLTQIKPRTAQTASVLATGRMPDDLPEPVVFAYKDVEPLNTSWSPLATASASGPPPFPVPASRRAVASALLDERSNLETCALILSLYQSQWEAANPAWSLRGRPDILATLYQIGFARSKPHGAPRSNAFGTRVREVYEQRWLDELLDTSSQRQG